MSEKEADPNAEGLDEHGLVIHEYVSTVLVVVPDQGYAETTMRYARSALYNVHVGTWSVASHDEDLIKGELQDEFQPDGKLDSTVTMDEYSGVIFCGGPGGADLSENADAQRLAREAAAAGKLIGAWGTSVGVLARAGVVGKKKVTGDKSVAAAVRSAGGKYTGTQLERSDNVVTAIDDTAGFRFAKALVQVVAIQNRR